jgi:hypothetical protein
MLPARPWLAPRLLLPTEMSNERNGNKAVLERVHERGLVFSNGGYFMLEPHEATRTSGRSRSNLITKETQIA